MYINSTIPHQLVKGIPTINQEIYKILFNEKELLNYRDLIFFDSNFGFESISWT